MTSTTLPRRGDGPVRTLLDALDTYLAPLADLAVRIAIFRVFFWSGLVKINDWQGTLTLFEYEYMVPVLPIGPAAMLTTAFELGATSLVLVGFGARLAALPLLGISLVIQFVLGAGNPAYNQIEHYLWMALLLTVIARGPGLLSIDALLRRKLLF